MEKKPCSLTHWSRSDCSSGSVCRSNAFPLPKMLLSSSRMTVRSVKQGTSHRTCGKGGRKTKNNFAKSKSFKLLFSQPQRFFELDSKEKNSF